MHFWMLALRNLGRNTKRNLATGSAIAFGFAGILLLCAYAYRAKNYIGVYTIYGIHTGHLAVYARGGFERFGFEPGRFSLSPAQQEKVLSVLKNEPSVEIFERQIRGQGLIGNGCISLPFQAQGYEPEVDRALRSHPEVKNWMPHFNYLLAGQGMWRYPASVNPILLSKGLALALGKSRLYDEIGSAPPSAPDCSNPREQGSRDSNVQLLAGAWAGTLSAADGEVVGLYTTGFQETENSGILAPVSFLQKLFDTDRIASFSVWLKEPGKLPEVRKRLEEKLGEEFETLRWDEERLSPYYVGTVDFLNTLVVAGALVLSSIIALSVLNSATMTILERSQEIGMYRSMGFRKSQLKILYVEESLWLSLFSLFSGAAIGMVSIHAINSADILYHPPGVAGGLTLVLVLPWLQAFLVGVLILVLVAIATLFSVSNRLRPTPADLLGGALR